MGKPYFIMVYAFLPVVKFFFKNSKVSIDIRLFA